MNKYIKASLKQIHIIGFYLIFGQALAATSIQIVTSVQYQTNLDKVAPNVHVINIDKPNANGLSQNKLKNIKQQLLTDYNNKVGGISLDDIGKLEEIIDNIDTSDINFGALVAVGKKVFGATRQVVNKLRNRQIPNKLPFIQMANTFSTIKIDNIKKHTLSND